MNPDFYLSTTGESNALATPRACWTRARLISPVRDDNMLVAIDPPLAGQPYGLSSHDITQLVLAPFDELSIFPVTRWPCPVYVARLLDDTVIKKGAFTAEQVQLIARGVLFRTREEATGQAARFT
jgi:hypothetical protein